MTHFPLDGPWTLTAVAGPAPADLLGREIPATVPGCAHLDLLAASHIAEPFDGDNEAAQQWIGSTVWRYRRTFTWADDGEARHDLVALGLDTLATVELNGTVVAQTENQNRSYRWGIDHLLREGENTLTVTFDAPVPALERRQRENGGHLFHVNHHPYNALRKTASNFGWDWGIDVATSGIWRSIGITGWSDVRLGEIRPLVEVAGRDGVLHAHVELVQDEVASERAVTVTVAKDGQTLATVTKTVRARAVVSLVVPDVELWWPRGHGSQPRYDVSVQVGEGSEQRWEHRVGFRTIELYSQPDEYGTPFELRVNGRSIIVRGANWIPDDAFVTRIDSARLERRIADATEAHMNLLRVWGGGMYESDEFYEICSREGVLVWQDFLLACAAYAEEDWLATEIEAEAREAIARLSRHAALALWCGNNENLVGFAEWGWRGTLAGRTWGEGYYTELFPRLLAELDPTRPYIPGSPYSSERHLSPNLDTDGTVHIWDVWNTKDYRAYAEWTPRFAAEFGFQGPAAYTTLFDVVHDVPLDPNGHDLLVHQKANNGNEKLANGLRGHLPVPRTIDEWHFATQLNQAHALRFGIGYFRALAPYCTGTVVWQLNDDWPVVSWAAVDFAERRKPLWYALREVYAPRLAVFQPAARLALGHEPTDSEDLLLVLLNETDEAVDAEIVLERHALAGGLLASATVPAQVAARGQARVVVPVDVATPGEARSEVLVARVGHGFDRAVHHFVEVIEQNLDPAAASVQVETTATGATVTVTATGLIRDLTVLADRADRSARVDDSLLTLLAGESARFELHADRPLTAAEVDSPFVVRSANQLLGDPLGEPLATTQASAAVVTTA